MRMQESGKYTGGLLAVSLAQLFKNDPYAYLNLRRMRWGKLTLWVSRSCDLTVMQNGQDDPNDCSHGIKHREAQSRCGVRLFVSFLPFYSSKYANFQHAYLTARQLRSCSGATK
jgi:hypothetical protein